METDLSCDWVALVADRSASFWRSMLVVDAMVGGVAQFGGGNSRREKSDSLYFHVKDLFSGT